MLEEGDEAPDFKIGQQPMLELAAGGGGAVVFFFPKAFTPG